MLSITISAALKYSLTAVALPPSSVAAEFPSVVGRRTRNLSDPFGWACAWCYLGCFLAHLANPAPYFYLAFFNECFGLYLGLAYEVHLEQLWWAICMTQIWSRRLTALRIPAFRHIGLPCFCLPSGDKSFPRRTSSDPLCYRPRVLYNDFIWWPMAGLRLHHGAALRLFS